MLSQNPIFPALAAVLMLTTQVAANPLQIALEPETPETPQIEYVDRHVILIVDTSSSVDDQEEALMMEGYARALTSEEAQMHFNAPTSYAISVIFFASNASQAQTYFVNTAEDAAFFANEIFFNFENETSQPVPIGLGSSTDIASALAEAINRFETETSDGFASVFRSVVIAGDEEENEFDTGFASTYMRTLPTDYNATVYGIPIVPEGTDLGADNNLIHFYQSDIATPDDLDFLEGSYELNVRPGAVYPADGFDDMVRPVSAALDLGAY